MNNPTIEIFDVETGENIVREMTDAEWADEMKRRESNAKIAEQLKQKQEEKMSIAAKLGLTPEELVKLLA